MENQMRRLVKNSLLVFALFASSFAHAMTAREARLILNVKADATPQEIKSARNALLKSLRSVFAGGQGDAELARQVIDAYNVLQALPPGAAKAEAETARRSSVNDPSTWREFSGDRPIPPHSTGAEFEFFTGYGADGNPLRHGGLHTTSLLRDFTYVEMLQRSGRYDRFYRQLYPRFYERVYEKGSPYRVKTWGLWRYNFEVLKRYPWWLNTIGVGVIVDAVANPHPQEMVAVGGAALWYALQNLRAYFPVKSRLTSLDLEFRNLMREMNLTNEDERKAELLGYDLAEMSAYATFTEKELQNAKALYPSFLRLLDGMPLAYRGFVQRAKAGVGLAGRLKAEYEADLKRRPKFWDEKAPDPLASRAKSPKPADLNQAKLEAPRVALPSRCEQLFR